MIAKVRAAVFIIEKAELDWSALRNRSSSFSNPGLSSLRQIKIASLVTVPITC